VESSVSGGDGAEKGGVLPEIEEVTAGKGRRSGRKMEAKRRKSWRSAGKWGRRFLRERERGENFGGENL